MKQGKRHSLDESKLLLIILLSILCAVLNSVHAEQLETKDSLTAAKPTRTLTFGGYFDTYFFTNFNHPATRNNLGSSGCARGFDRFNNQFQLGMLLTQINYTYRRVEFTGEVGFGPNMQYASYGSAYGYKWGTMLASNTYTAVLIKQAYIKFNATKKLSFTMGQFETHIGYEVISTPTNFHYSINNTFNSGIPFYHVGLKGDYAVSDKLGVMVGLVNGTDNINSNNNSLKFIGQLSYKPNDNVDLSFNTIQGNEANARANGQDTTSYFGILDFIGRFQVTPKFKVILWTMYGSQRGEFQGGTYFPTMRHWSGVNFYTQYTVTSAFAIGTRVEHFDNTDGVRQLLTNGQGTYVNTFTLTGNFQLEHGSLTLRPELRFDDFQKMKHQNGETTIQQFADRRGNLTKSSQATLGMAAILKF